MKFYGPNWGIDKKFDVEVTNLDFNFKRFLWACLKKCYLNSGFLCYKNLHAYVKVLFFVISEFQLAVRHLDVCVSIQEYILSYFTRSYTVKEKRKQVTVKLEFFPLLCDKQMQAHAQFMLVCDGSQCHIGIVMTVLWINDSVLILDFVFTRCRNLVLPPKPLRMRGLNHGRSGK